MYGRMFGGMYAGMHLSIYKFSAHQPTIRLLRTSMEECMDGWVDGWDNIFQYLNQDHTHVSWMLDCMFPLQENNTIILLVENDYSQWG